MGTRSLTHIKGDVWKAGETPDTILTFYRQYDGYPSGHGADLASFLDGYNLINGISGQPGKSANGMGCLAAQVIANFKNESGVGGIYVYKADTQDVGEEYVYTVYQSAIRNEVGNLCMTVYSAWRKVVLFDGPVSEFDAEAVKQRDDESITANEL